MKRYGLMKLGTGISKPTVFRYIAELKEVGILRREGVPKNGIWVILWKYDKTEKVLSGDALQTHQDFSFCSLFFFQNLCSNNNER